jgi:hypothetical protein
LDGTRVELGEPGAEGKGLDAGEDEGLDGDGAFWGCGVFFFELGVFEFSFSLSTSKEEDEEKKPEVREKKKNKAPLPIDNSASFFTCPGLRSPTCTLSTSKNRGITQWMAAAKP